MVIKCAIIYPLPIVTADPVAVGSFVWRSMGKFKDLTGMVFGHLYVIEYAGYNDNGVPSWRCRCGCGNIIERPGYYLTSGDTKSCGCYNKYATSKRCRIDITGQTFGKLTVLRFDQRKNKQSYWMCQCECGTVVSVYGENLKRGMSRSCGCENRKVASQLMTKMHYKHGLSRTKEYTRDYARKAKDKRRALDVDWNCTMGRELRKMFPDCVVCHSTKNLEIDHVRPASKGSGLKAGNATVLCRKCNHDKLATLPEDLPDYMRIPILESAAKFKEYWESLQAELPVLSP